VHIMFRAVALRKLNRACPVALPKAAEACGVRIGNQAGTEI
jgi:hypothetical protein